MSEKRSLAELLKRLKEKSQAERRRQLNAPKHKQNFVKSIVK